MQDHSNSYLLSPLPRGQPIQAVPETGCYLRGHHPQINQRLNISLSEWAFLMEKPRGHSKPQQGQWALGLFKCPLEHSAHSCPFAERLFKNYRWQYPCSTHAGYVFTPLFPQSMARFVILKIGQIFALQQQSSLLLSSWELSSSRQAELFFFCSWQKNIWPSSGQKRRGFIAFSPSLQHAVALLGW